MRIEKAKGIETSMVNQTKQALEASPLKHFAFTEASGQDYNQRSDEGLRHQPNGVLLSFKDIYDLVEWSCLEDATRGHWRARRLTVHGQKDCCRFSKLFMRTSRLL